MTGPATAQTERTTGRSQVLVIGAGPAGCAAGITLARAGIDVCVMDRATFPRPKTCGDALSNLAVAAARALGAALDELPAADVGGAAVIFPDGTRIVRRYPERGLIVPRLEFDAALVAALRASGARVLEGTKVGALTRDGGVIDGATGERLDWRCDLAIAADGPASVAWHALGLPYPRRRRLGFAATCYAEGVAYPDGRDTSSHYLSPELPCGYGWVFPAAAGRANAGVFVRAEEYRTQGVPLRVLLERFLAERQDRFGARPAVSRPHVWSLPLGPAPWPPAAPGVLLAGDAGGFIDPLTGEGIWQALRTGQIAGEVAAAALRRDPRAAATEAPAQYLQRCRREVTSRHAARRRAQELLRAFVVHRLYRSTVLRTAMQWAYARGTMETSKKV